MKKNYIYLMIIILIAIFLRVYNHSPLSGGDDSEYAQFAILSIEQPRNIFYLEAQDAHIRWGDYTDIRPFSRLLMITATVVFGNNDFAVLFFPTLFTVLSIMLLFVLVKKYYSGNIALLTTFIFAILPFGLAFTRIGLLDAQLIFYCLLITWLLIKAIETDKIYYLYIAGLILAIDMLTTAYRGVFPLIALVPLLLYKKNRRIITHTCIAFCIGILIYVGYALLPLLWGNSNYYEDLLFMTGRALGQEAVKGEFVSFFTGMSIIWKLYLFTPFMNLIIVPLFYGLFLLIKKPLEKINLVWIIWLMASLIQFVQGQPYPNRQMVILPAFCFIAAYGLYNAYNTRWRIMFFATLFYAIFSYMVFPIFYAVEFNSMSALFKNFIYTVPFLLIPLVFITAYINKKTIFIFYLFVMFTISLLLVGFGIGAYKRSNEPVVISKFLKENMGESEYSCIAGTEASTYTFYTGKKCAWFLFSNLSFIQEQTAIGNLKYFIIANKGLTVGLGNYEDIINNNVSTNGIIYWNVTYTDKYDWIINNTKNITQKLGLKQYMVFEYD